MVYDDPGLPPQYLAAVASNSEPDQIRVVQVAKAAFDEVIAPTLDAVPATESLAVFRSDKPGRPQRQKSVKWETVIDAAEQGVLDSFCVSLVRPYPGQVPPADFPLFLSELWVSQSSSMLHADGRKSAAETTVCWSLERGVVADRGIDRRMQDQSVAWLEHAVGELEGDAGYLTIDRHLASPNGVSPWERWGHLSTNCRDFKKYAWTHVWGVSLSDDQVEAIGGQSVLSIDDGLARRSTNDRWWVQASRKIETLTDAEIAASRETTQDILPPPTRIDSPPEGLGEPSAEVPLRV